MSATHRPTTRSMANSMAGSGAVNLNSGDPSLMNSPAAGSKGVSSSVSTSQGVLSSPSTSNYGNSYNVSAATKRASTDAQMKRSAEASQELLLNPNSGHFSLIRALHLADVLTELNGFCGVMSIFSSLRYCLDQSISGGVIEAHTDWGWLYVALGFLPFGMFFDFMDGKVARWRRKSSIMGQEMDSLADLISFGVAPAAVAFCLGMRSFLDTIFLCFFVLCGLTRLARFNVTTQMIPKDEMGKAKYFEGTPIPTSLVLDGLMAWWIKMGWVLDNLPLGVVGKGTMLEFHPIVLIYALHGCLMTSRSFKVPKP